MPLNDGFIKANEAVYDLLTLGTALLKQSMRNKRSFTLQYIDWKNPANNVFHVADEFEVERRGTHRHCRPDLVLFVNGIPLAVIECKRPDSKEPMTEAISQHLRNQGNDHIPQLFSFCQLLVAVSQNQGKYATAGTPEKFWRDLRDELKGTDADSVLAETPLAYSVPASNARHRIPVRLKDIVNRRCRRLSGRSSAKPTKQP